MKKYKAIIFDFDGTLANTYEGIFNSYVFAAQCMDLPCPTKELVDGAIGASLRDVFIDRFGLDQEKANTAVEYYRTRYAREGIHEVELYPGMKEFLEKAYEDGMKLGVATLKLEAFAVEMLEYMGVGHLFECIKGIDPLSKHNKKTILLECLKEMGIDKEEAVLIGDSSFDEIGAREAGVDFIAVTYGFGFHSEADICELNTVMIAQSTTELDVLLS